MQTQLTRLLANSALLLVITLTASTAAAVEWVDYEGEIPDNAVSVNEGTEDRPICRRNARIGFVNDNGRCVSIRRGEESVRKRQTFQILVETPAVENVEVVENIIIEREGVSYPTLDIEDAILLCHSAEENKHYFYPSGVERYCGAGYCVNGATLDRAAREAAFLWRAYWSTLYNNSVVRFVTGSREDPMFDEVPSQNRFEWSEYYN